MYCSMSFSVFYVDRYSNPASDGSDAESTADPVEQRSHAYDENGDLVLIVGPQAEGSFRVCSRTLARASVVFEKMLFGVFAESRSRYHSEDYWEIKLPDDDADSMEIFLNIIHGRPADVPRTLALRALWPYMSDALCTSRSIWLGGCHERAQF
ncbi:nuclear pore protein-like protein [Colletotrichum plurivorum]|uniref:Nuclear pore protein-like protein n=1 Tax=Colletotrichum plurivorum TaxID=2175906 RepID=A0A8H6N8B5_9PEZI|nr:nuclear pore protein-like protein [Colletotrichum plurivorum]